MASNMFGVLSAEAVINKCSNMNFVVQVQAKAQAMATALQTIGKFTIKKRSGDKESIFGRYAYMFSILECKVLAMLVAFRQLC